MSFFNNEKHFLHKSLTLVESIGIDGKKNGFENFLVSKGIILGGEAWDDDHSVIDWKKANNHFRFFYEYEGSEPEIKALLRESELKNHEHLVTWVDWEDPIVKVKTEEFIENWIGFNAPQ